MQPNIIPDSQLMFEGVRFDVRRVPLPGHRNKTILRDAIIAPPAVVILPVLDDNTILMIRNHRFAVGQTLWELPAGTVEPGENPDACAGRELIEETGYRAANIAKLLDFFPSPGICTEHMHAYLATQLAHVGQNLDDNEQITVEPLPFDKALQMIAHNIIRDAKTIALLLYYATFTRPARKATG